MKRVFLFVLALVVVTAPLFASADLVPCDGPGCRACDLVSLAQRVLTWFIMISAFIIALAFALGGFKMVMSAGDTGAVSSARQMMTNSVVGFIILLSGWLIVDTVLKQLVGNNLGRPWNEIQCVEAETVSVTPPPAAGECPVSPLTPITDSRALQMEAMNGNAVIWEGTNPNLQTCVNKFIGKVGGGSVESAYRPQAYQAHLYEVKSKWCDSGGLKDNTNPECSALKSAVSAEIQKHRLSSCGAVAMSNSSHTNGRGVDISGPAHGSPAVRKAAEESCLYWNNFNNDPNHYTLREGCSCN